MSAEIAPDSRKAIRHACTALLTLVGASLALPSPAAFAFSAARKGAQGYCAASPDPSPVTPGTPFRVNPSTIRQRLASSDLDVLTALNQVHRSKDNENLAVTELLPSLNINPGAAFTGVGFFASTITALLPFLVPDNWFALDAAKSQLEADKQAYRIAQLNDYAVLYATYLALVYEEKAKQILQTNVKDWQLIASIAAKQHQAGQGVPTDVMAAQGDLGTAQIQLDQLLQTNITDLRNVLATLNLDPQQNLVIETTTVPSSAYEHVGLDQAAYAAFIKSPEEAQVRALFGVADSGVKSAEYSFIDSGTLNAGGISGGKYSLGAQSGASISLHLGLDIFPKIEFAKRLVDDEVLNQSRVLQSFQQAIGVALEQLPLQLQALATARENVSLANKTYRITLKNWIASQAQLNDVASAHVTVLQDEIIEFAAETAVAQSRITLHRAFLDDQFAELPGCDYQQVSR